MSLKDAMKLFCPNFAATTHVVEDAEYEIVEPKMLMEGKQETPVAAHGSANQD